MPITLKMLGMWLKHIGLILRKIGGHAQRRSDFAVIGQGCLLF